MFTHYIPAMTLGMEKVEIFKFPNLNNNDIAICASRWFIPKHIIFNE